MKQGTVLTRVIFLMLLLALTIYAVAAAVSSMGEALTTVTAIAYEVGDGFQATGFVVRDETVLNAPSGISVLLRSEGERVAQGEALAATYSDAAAQEAQRRIDALELELERYESVLDNTEILQGNTLLDEQIQQKLQEFAKETVRGDLSRATSYSNTIKSLVLRRYMTDDGREAMQTQVQSIREELANLRSRLSGAVIQKTADTTGYFSGSTDGYESLLTSNRILTMSPEELEQIAAQEPSPATDSIGRLILSPQWYFACVVPEEKLEPYSVGDQLRVEFTHDFSEVLSMRVERISDVQDGKRVLVLSCGDYIAEAACLRSQSADIVLHTYSGVRVPKQALHYDNENQRSGVYILEGARVRWKSVTPIYEAADYYLVELDKSDTRHLWPGDDVILTTAELFDGKVIEN